MIGTTQTLLLLTWAARSGACRAWSTFNSIFMVVWNKTIQFPMWCPWLSNSGLVSRVKLWHSVSRRISLWFITLSCGHNLSVPSDQFKPRFTIPQPLVSIFRGLSPILCWADRGDLSLLLPRQVHYLPRLRKQEEKLCKAAIVENSFKDGAKIHFLRFCCDII